MNKTSRKRTEFNPTARDKSNKIAKSLGQFSMHGKDVCDGKMIFKSAEDYKIQYWNKANTLMISQFTIKGFNNNYIEETEISRMLNTYGLVCIFKERYLEEWLALPCQILRVSVANKPTAVRVYSPYLPEYREVLEFPKDDFFVLWDSKSHVTSKILFDPWICRLAEICVTKDVNMFGLRTPVVGVSTIVDKLSLDNIVYMLASGIPFLNVKKQGGKIDTVDRDITKQLSILNLNVPYNIDKLEVERKATWNTILETIGYKVNVNASKKERMISDEVQGNLEETIGFYESRKSGRKAAVEWLKEHDCNAELEEVTKIGEIYDNAENGS